MVWPFSAAETVQLVTAFGVTVVTIITAIRTGQVRVRQGRALAQQTVIEKKVDSVHEQTNSHLERLSRELAESRQETKGLQVELRNAVVALGIADATRKDLARETARDLERRGEDDYDHVPHIGT